MTGGHIDDDTRDELFIAGYQMAGSLQRRRKFRTNTYEGCVETSFKHVRLGALSGYQFTAHLDGKQGSFEVVYFLRYRDLAKLDTNDGEMSRWLGLDDDKPASQKKRQRPGLLARARNARDSN